jgi:hypothetical protein
MVPVIAGVVAVLVIAGMVAAVLRSRSRAQAEELAGVGVNEFLQAPPTSFPSDAPTPPVVEPVVTAVPAAEQEDDDEDGAVVMARLRIPGSGAIAGVAPEPLPRVESVPEPVAESAVDAEIVIDLVAADASFEQAAGTDLPPWHDVVLAPEPDAVDHVLQALINRARFKQVGVEEVATELVERSDLQGDEVSTVLASLVGRADTPAGAGDEAPSSELTLFNNEVPSRPGQLSDFAKLSPAEKKRIIVRVLCLLVARSEDQQLPPRADAANGRTKSWPLARAVWPVAGGTDDDGETPLPSRRLAKSR